MSAYNYNVGNNPSTTIVFAPDVIPSTTTQTVVLSTSTTPGVSNPLRYTVVVETVQGSLYSIQDNGGNLVSFVY